MRESLEKYVKENEKMVFELLKELCSIPAPSHHEERRAEFCKKWLEAQGAEGVFIDEALNVIYPYACEEGRPVAIFMAHMDTVFPDMEPMGVEERDGKLFSPGVGDDTANLAILLMMARYLAMEKPETVCGIVISPNACEEGLGNLKGARALVARYEDRLQQVISFDGNADDICTRAVGSERYRVEVLTEGGHSYSDFGNRNAIAYLSKMIEKLYQYQVPQDGSKTTYNVGMIQGGTSVNTIAQQAEMLFEFRSDNRESMLVVKQNFENVLEEFREKGLEIRVTLLGERPCGKTGEKSEGQKRVEKTCKEALEKWTGKPAELRSGSTDCNIPLSMGIPAATIGLIQGKGAHTREEWISIDSLKPGMCIAGDMLETCLK
ncbi:MAG: M20/M25/M40 family metallo-hydrolase [Eubacteriales bacterium]|nr:M20/M25/M40 family metallo-hydrolase [Eubacteriales bacterium]